MKMIPYSKVLHHPTSSRAPQHSRSIWRLVIAAGLLLVIWRSPVRPGVVVGDSMSPSLHNGQVFLLARASKGDHLSRGEVVVFRLHEATLIKRIVALPGDAVWGIEWPEFKGRPDYLLAAHEIDHVQAFLRRYPSIGRLIEVRVPPGHVFVVGDAISNSVDSRQFGPVPITAIYGRLVSPPCPSLDQRGSPPKVIASAG